MNNIAYKFVPPLASPDELPTRMDVIHQKVCTPSPSWLLTNPLALIILVACTALSYGVYVGSEGIVDGLSVHAPRLEAGISVIFGSTHFFSYFVFGSFWFAIVAHVVEACIAMYYCHTSLHLHAGPTILWGVLIFLVGYPIFNELQDLLAVQTKNNIKSH
jgi:hypothetical protein